MDVVVSCVWTGAIIVVRSLMGVAVTSFGFVIVVCVESAFCVEFVLFCVFAFGVALVCVGWTVGTLGEISGDMGGDKGGDIPLAIIAAFSGFK
jgi:hypothetical protein